MIAIIPNEHISTGDLKLLRQISNLSISEIKQASANQNSIKTFEEFGNAWETDRIELSLLANKYAETKTLPFQFVLMEDDEIEAFLSPEMLNDQLKHLRHIELETQRNSDLENGFITTPNDFEPHDEDWTIVNHEI